MMMMRVVVYSPVQLWERSSKKVKKKKKKKKKKVMLMLMMMRMMREEQMMVLSERLFHYLFDSVLEVTLHTNE